MPDQVSTTTTKPSEQKESLDNLGTTSDVKNLNESAKDKVSDPNILNMLSKIQNLLSSDISTDVKEKSGNFDTLVSSYSSLLEACKSSQDAPMQIMDVFNTAKSQLDNLTGSMDSLIDFSSKDKWLTAVSGGLQAKANDNSMAGIAAGTASSAISGFQTGGIKGGLMSGIGSLLNTGKKKSGILGMLSGIGGSALEGFQAGGIKGGILSGMGSLLNTGKKQSGILGMLSGIGSSALEGFQAGGFKGALSSGIGSLLETGKSQKGILGSLSNIGSSAFGGFQEGGIKGMLSAGVASAGSTLEEKKSPFASILKGVSAGINDPQSLLENLKSGNIGQILSSVNVQVPTAGSLIKRFEEKAKNSPFSNLMNSQTPAA